MGRLLILLLLLCPLVFAFQETKTQQGVYDVQKKPSLMLYYADYCPYSQKVLRYLKKIHKTVPMKNVNENPKYKEELSRAGNQLLVPCLVIDGTAIYDADTIVDWLSKHQEQLEGA